MLVALDLLENKNYSFKIGSLNHEKGFFMDLKIPYAQVFDKKQAYQGAQQLIPSVAAKFGVKADVESREEDFLLIAKGSGFKAQIQFLDAYVEVRVELGLLLKPFRGKILETIEKQIKKVV